MSEFPLRLRFAASVGVVVAAIAGTVSSLWFWLVRPGAAAFWFMASGILLATLLVDRVAERLIYRRLSQLREAMQRAAAGQLSVRVSVDRLDEIGVIAQGWNDILQGLERLNDAVDVRVAAATARLREKNVAIADSHREMAVLSEELARAGRLAALGQAAANMAHQIGTPLNLISGYVQLLIESTPPSASLERLKAIQDQTAKVTAIVRTALDSSRPPAIPHERTDLGALVGRVCRMAAPMLDQAGVQVEVDVPGHAAELLADPVQLELALLNLISNAVDAMASGGKLTVRLDRSFDRLHLEVVDTGSGIAPDLVARIFDPWVTTKAPGKGSGLGLSIARQVVASHGGAIRVDNRPGAGAVFTIDLPALRPEPPDIAHAEDPGR
jgi:signal transduction histidine kinase